MSAQSAVQRPILSRAVIIAAVALAMAATGLAVGAAAGIGELETSVALALAIPLALVVGAYPWAAVMVWVAAMPFFVVADSASVGAGVWAVHRLLIPSTIVLLLVYRLLGLSRSRFHLSTADIFVVIFLVLAYVNIFALSNNPVRMSVAIFDNLVIPISLFWLVRLADPGPAELRRLMPVVVGIVMVQVGVGVLSWLAPGVLPGAWLGRAGERTIGTLGGPAPYSITLVFGALLFIHAGADSSHRWVRWLLTLLGGRGLRRGSPLALARELDWRRSGHHRPARDLPPHDDPDHRRRCAGRPPACHRSAVRAVRRPRRAARRCRYGRLEARHEQRRASDDLHRAMVGFGYGNFERFDESFKVRVGDIPVQPGSAHHAYLALAAENGIPALVLYLLPAAWLLMRTIQLRHFMPTDPYVNKNLVSVLWFALLSQFLVANFMDMLHSSPWGVGLWWLSLGLIHATLSRAAANQRASRRPVPLQAWLPT